MKLRDIHTGATYEPSSELVAEMMAADPRFERVDEDKPKAAPNRTARKAAKPE